MRRASEAMLCCGKSLTAWRSGGASKQVKMMGAGLLSLALACGTSPGRVDGNSAGASGGAGESATQPNMFPTPETAAAAPSSSPVSAAGSRPLPPVVQGDTDAGPPAPMLAPADPGANQPNDGGSQDVPQLARDAISQPVTLMWRDVPLAATLYLPDGVKGPVPAVVTGPGFGGVKEMLIPAFAASAAAAGIATLAVDFAGFGGSGGMPRQNVDPPAQVEQMIVGLDHLAANPAIDPARLGVWGTSLSGGHALAVAIADQRIRCVVAIIPFVGVSESATSDEVVALVAEDTIARAAGQAGKTIPAVGRPGDVAVMTTDGAWEWSEAITTDAPSWRNEVTLESLLNMSTYTPAAMVSSIQVPLRAILATDDSITPAALARDALAGVPMLDVAELPDTHFELFTDRLEETITLTTEWLTMHL